MSPYGKNFMIGAACTLLLVATTFKIFNAGTTISLGPTETPTLVISPDTVVIDRLPSYKTVNGINVAFNGKEKYPQLVLGTLAKNIVITSFRAEGENAHKSSITITWEDGTIDKISAGVTNRSFPPEKRAKEILVSGYSAHERQLFHDTSKPGILNWEIIYEPIE